MSTTPGLWQAIEWTRHAATSVVVDDSTCVTGKRLIAECETEDDARLIADAPRMFAEVARLRLLNAELLEALQLLLADLDKWPSLHEGGDYLHGGMQLRARAAIKKAIDA